MCYCINPKCQNPHNPDSLLFCHSCGSELLLEGRYRVVQLWQRRRCTAVYEVDDCATLPFGNPYEVREATSTSTRRLGERRIPKVLKVLENRNNIDHQLVELFEREATVLSQLDHPGIPKGDGYFTFWVNQNREPLPCLVMERIQGVNLQEYLRRRCDRPINQELAVEWLIKLATILDRVHEQNLFHRDVKPSNIMLRPDGELVLIDFGAVREVTDTYGEAFEEHDVTRIYSVGYTAPEQRRGQAVPQSDFFALGRTFMYLLTGVEPRNLPRDSTDEDRLIWQDSAKVSELLADFLDELMAPLPENRPQSTQAILQRLAQIQQTLFRQSYSQTLTLKKSGQIENSGTNRVNSQKIEIRIPLKKLLAGGTSLLLGVSVIYWYFTGVNGCSRIWLRSFPVGDHLSCGEEILTPDSAISEKQKGTQAYAAGNYDQAVAWLNEARQKQPNDPEVSIYLNNAQIEADKGKAFTIAVAAPISRNLDIALEILRGVAQAQNEVNHGKKIHGLGLKVLIADDGNNPNQARQIAEALTAQSNILAVVGHYASEITIAAMDIYEQRNLVLISPGSTSANLPRPKDKFFFRTVPTNRLNAQKLSSYLIDEASQQKAAVFYNPQSDFSKSFYDQFVASFSESKRQVLEVEASDLSNPFFKAGAAIDQAHKKGATAIVIIPDGGTSRYSHDNTIKLIRANRRRLWMAGANTVSSPETLLVGQDAVDRLVVAVPWIAMKSPNPDFPKAAQTLWRGEVTSSTASAYDAAQVLIKALETTPNPNRLDVQKALSNPSFEATTGATGLISFLPNGDRKQPLVELAKVVPSKCSDYGYIFVPVSFPTAEAESLGGCRKEK